jgi:hypothetical protein
MEAGLIVPPPVENKKAHHRVRLGLEKDIFYRVLNIT